MHIRMLILRYPAAYAAFKAGRSLACAQKSSCYQMRKGTLAGTGLTRYKISVHSPPPCGRGFKTRKFTARKQQRNIFHESEL